MRHKAGKWLAGLMAAGLASAAAIGPARADRDVPVDPGHTYGAWEGWGCSLAWWAVQFGTRDDLADTLFTTKAVTLTTDSGTYRLPGLGLNIARYNIGGTTTAPAGGASAVIPSNMAFSRQVEGFWLNWESDDPASASFNWSADAKQRAMLQKAKARGVDRFEAFSDSPMWWMCYNHSTAGSDNGGDNLQPWNYQTFAQYLAIVAAYARDHWGVTFTDVEPFNEPSAWWWKYPLGQEGCRFDVATQKTILGYLRSELDARGLSTMPIVASDENSVDDALRTWNAFDTGTKAKVARVNVHGYSGLSAYRGTNRPALYGAVNADGKRLWQTEYGENDGTGATMAQSIALDINTMHVSAWVYWQPFDSGGWGLVQSNHSDNWIGPPNPKYSVMAQFSRHIRPGMTILQSGDPDTVAAYDSANHKLVLVTVNAGEDAWMAYDLTRFVTAAGPVNRWLTDTGPGYAYARMGDLTLANRAIRVFQPAGSVQTLEFQNVYLRATEPYTVNDLLRVLATIDGQSNPSSGDLARLDITGPGPGARLDLCDAILIARKVAGLDTNP